MSLLPNLRTHLLLAILGLGMMNPLTVSNLQASEIKPEDKAQFEQMIRDYILEHPEVIMESVTRFQANQKSAAEEMARQNLVSQKDLLLNDPTSPVIGNLKGDVAVVEFFDYRCGYCKKVHADVMSLIESDKNIRLIFKEFPILGPDSETASRAALSIWNSDPDKYIEFHNELMTVRGALPATRVLEIAGSLGIDIEKLTAGMSSAKVTEAIQGNHNLASSLNISGTPAFVIGGELVPGAVDLATLKNLIKKARGS